MQAERYILLADADRSHIEAVRASLAEADPPVGIVVVRDGKEALDAAIGVGKFAHDRLRTKPLFVLVDLKLPKLNGHIVSHLLRTSGHGKDIPIILMVPADESEVPESMVAGVAEVIPKPVGKDGVKRLLDRYGAQM